METSDWRSWVRSVLAGEHPVYGRSFEIFIQVLIAVSLVSVTIDSLPNLSERVQTLLAWEEIIIVGVFTIEYMLRATTAERPLGYVFSFWGFIDLAAIAPFYLGLSADLRAARALRLLRVFRAMKLLRYNAASERLKAAFMKVREELLIFGALALIVLFLSAVGIYNFEHEAQPEVFGSIPESLWWSATTLTTVGYGDAVPITLGGRLFTFCVLVIGLGVVAVPTGLIASALTEVRREEKERRQQSARAAQFDNRKEPVRGVCSSKDASTT
jgi:voltage-gated potassium channel